MAKILGAKVTIEDNSGRFITASTQLLDTALERMSFDVKQIATIRVPFKDNGLQKSADNKRLGLLKHRVVFDKEYAAYQENARRKDGSRKVRKYTTPGTGPHYLENAAAQVTKDGINYLKQANRSLRI